MPSNRTAFGKSWFTKSKLWGLPAACLASVLLGGVVGAPAGAFLLGK